MECKLFSHSIAFIFQYYPYSKVKPPLLLCKTTTFTHLNCHFHSPI